MKSPFVYAGALSAGLILASCGGTAADPSTTNTAKSSGAPAPDFTLPALEGGKISLSNFRGKNVVLINFWSTTCDPCMTEMPHLVDLYNREKENGLVVLAISADGPESLAQVSPVARNKNMSFPVLLDEETTVTARYNPKRDLPFTVLVGKDGSILHKRNGYTAGDEKTLEVEVQAALAN